MKGKKYQQKRRFWYKLLKKILVIRYKKPTFYYLGDKPNNQSIILSNHVGTEAPMSLEMYASFPIRMWGTHEMNSGLIKLYKYQTNIYYHKKKGWNIHLSRLFCLLASPITNLFYKGLRLISTYPDYRLRKTIKESLKVLIENKENIIIFPEHSESGYLDELKGFHQGFILLAETALKKGLDVLIYVSYYNKDTRTYTFSKPQKYSELKSRFPERKKLTDHLVNSCNALRTIK